MPLSGRGQARIGHKAVSHAEKTLGAMTSLNRDSRAAIKLIQDKAQQWVNDVQNGHLHDQNIWCSLKFQLCPRMLYGICSSAATFEELSKALQQQYHQILPLDRVACTTTVQSRTHQLRSLAMG